MRMLSRIAFCGWFVLALAWINGPRAWAQPASAGASAAPDTRGYTTNEDQSKALTTYLTQHRLPLVGARVLQSPSSANRVILLYGYVATDFGKSDAVTKARLFLNDSTMAVENRIVVNPDLLASNHPAASPDNNASGAADASNPDADADNSMPGVQSYQNQANQSPLPQYSSPAPSSNSGMSAMALPLLMLGLSVLSMGVSHGAISIGGGPGGGFGMGMPPGYGSMGGMGPNPYPGYQALAPPSPGSLSGSSGPGGYTDPNGASNGNPNSNSPAYGNPGEPPPSGSGSTYP